MRKWMALVTAGLFLGAWIRPTAGADASFAFRLERGGLTSAGVFDEQGHLVRTLWSMKEVGAGEQKGEWDGRDELQRPAAQGEYRFKVVVNHSTYRNIGIIGNSGPTRPTHTPGHMESVATDANGAVYTANGWEEEGADFKKWDAEGRPVYGANFQIRNGHPNGAPYSIAVDDQFIYCGMNGWAGKEWKSKQQIQKFRASDGKQVKFTQVPDPYGHIELYEFPEKQVPAGTSEADARLMGQPLRALAVHGETIYCCDALGGKVHRFDKTTGKKLGEFAVKLPTAIAIDGAGVIYVGHEHSRVSRFKGGVGEEIVSDAGDVESLAVGGDGRLYVADGARDVVKIYDPATKKLVRTFGKRAEPGDYLPDRFYGLRGASVDRAGNLVTISNNVNGGARLAKFSPEGKCLWEQMGLEFVSLGTYASWRPDELISLQYHRYILNRATGRFEYRGNLFAGERKYYADIHGTPRFLKLGGGEFFYTAQGDGMQVFRRSGDQLIPAAMVGGREPTPRGKDKSAKLGQWTWHDADGNGKVDEEEVDWFRKPGEGKYAVFGINVDAKGTLVYCEHHSHAIWEMPLARLDERGNPVYDWKLARQIIPRETPEKFFALMAVRSDDGTLYAFGRSDAFAKPKNTAAWMGGWALVRYAKDGRVIFYTRMPDLAVGMDYIPGGKGVLLGYFEKAHVWHYTSDGLHIGTSKPGPACGGETGWLDNTASLACNRDPRDGIIDCFTADDFLYRIIWHRIDDRDVEMVEGKLVLR